LQTMRKKMAIILGACLALAHTVFAQQPDAEGGLVKWMTLQEAMEKMQTQPRPLVVDFYTDWCGWCKQMMRTTYADPDVAQYINTNFYPVKFNAETKDTIEYLGQKYGPVGTGRATNALAIKFLQNKLMYPTTLFLNGWDKQKNDFIFSMLAQGYLEKKKFEPTLVFTLENAFRSSNYEDFHTQYDKAFYDSTTDDKLKEIKWLKPYEAFNKKESSKKKTMVLVHTDWCNSCRVMQRTSFIDSVSEKYLKEKFDLVDFNPEITDSITFKGQVYGNPRSPQMPFHTLAVALCRNSMTLPDLVILDENLNIIDAIPFYINPDVLKNIAKYYGENIYKTTPWTEFMANENKKDAQANKQPVKQK
jgi:thioredoxin-related protein